MSSFADHPTGPRPHGPHHHHCIINFEGELTHEELARLLERIAGQLRETDRIELDGHKIAVPDPVYSIVRHERGPRGDLIVKVECKWDDGKPSTSATPIVALLPPESAAASRD